jgi:hypothetical protein
MIEEFAIGALAQCNDQRNIKDATTDRGGALGENLLG